MTDHRSKYYEYLNKGLEFFEQGDVSNLTDTIFLMKMHLDKTPLTHPETDAMVFSNFAEICSDVLGAIFAEDPQAEKRSKEKIRKISEWAEQYNKKALSTYLLAVSAQINEVNWAANALQTHGKSFMAIVKEAGTQKSSYARSYNFTGNLTASAISKKRFRNALEKLLSMFTEYFSTKRSVELFVEYGAFLLNLADFCEESHQGDPKQVLNTLLKVDAKKLGFYEGTEDAECERLATEYEVLLEKAKANLTTL